MIRAILLWAVCMLFALTCRAAPQWIVHASVPGPDIAAVGLSRFDQLFIQADGSYLIPYPFEKLSAFLEAKIDSRNKVGLRQVYVPIGRSLQREAAAPDYFRFPREVIALEGEPATAAGEAGLVMEYRLFIAHQPKTETLEIISYNDEAARFEFQVVDNYTAAQKSVVRQANRVMCLSCHQNAAPLFPQNPWTETSFNVEVANQLIQKFPQKFDSLIGVLTNDAGVIDVLSERANYLSAAQYIWQNGCSSIRCRAALLRAVLQFRLSGKFNFDRQQHNYQFNYLAELERNWQQKWPQGLALAGSRIASVDPFLRKRQTVEQDPLFSRPAHANWYQADSILAGGIVHRLAGFFTQADIERFDKRLLELSGLQSGDRRSFEVPCRVGNLEEIVVELICTDGDSANSLRAEFEIERAQQQLKSLRVLQLKFPLDPNLWQPKVSGFKNIKTSIDIALSDPSSRLSQRLSDGNSIHSAQLMLDWDQSGKISGGRLRITLSDDFKFLDEALAGLIEDNLTANSDSLSALPFRRQAIVKALMQALGMASLRWVQVSKQAEPATKPSPSALSGDLALLYPYCGHCHSNNSDNPPGFLHGKQVKQQLLHCAPRILTRMNAWQADSNFAKSPMPPAASLGFSGTNAEDWPTSEHYQRLRTAIRSLVDKHYSGDQISAWDNGDPGDLPFCLAAH